MASFTFVTPRWERYRVGDRIFKEIIYLYTRGLHYIDVWLWIGGKKNVRFKGLNGLSSDMNWNFCLIILEKGI